MADVTQSLFGITPESLMAAREQQMQEQAMKYATLDPYQKVSYSASLAGDRLGSALGGLLGAEDPQLKLVRQRQQILQGSDIQTPQGLKDLSQKLYQAGDYQGAQQALAQAQAREAAQVEQAQKMSVANKNVAETQGMIDTLAAKKARVQMLVDAGLSENEAQGIASNDTAFANYVKGKKVETPSDYAIQAQKLGFGSKPYLSDYSPEQIKAMEQGVFTHKAGIAQAGAAVNKPVDVAAIIKEIGTTQDIKGKAETWKQAGAAYTAQVPMLNKLDEVAAVLPKSFTGSFSEPALQFGKALSALGVPVDEKKLANTEYVNSVSAQVLQTIARSFPGSLAVKEMEQLVKSKFNSKQQLETMSRILRDLRTELQAGALSYEQLSRLPEVDRYSKDMNFLTGQNYKKLNRLNALMDKHQSGTISKAEREEAQKLQQELK